MSNNSLPTFGKVDGENMAQKWLRWKRAFEIMLEANGITDNQKKKIQLLHAGGLELQDIYFALPGASVGESGTATTTSRPATTSSTPMVTDETATDVYKEAITLLDGHFIPQRNFAVEMLNFRSMVQKHGESIDSFVLRLRQAATTCNFTDVDNEISVQIIKECRSNEMRRELLRQGNVNLSDVVKTVKIFEATESQAVKMEADVVVQKIDQHKKKEFVCFRCNKKGHVASDKTVQL